jgi:hypothetical protein
LLSASERSLNNLIWLTSKSARHFLSNTTLKNGTTSAAKQAALSSQPERFPETFDDGLEEGIHALIDK